MKESEFSQYQKQANGFMSAEAKKQPLLDAALGLAGECGECADLIKKHLFLGHELKTEDLKEELGDILWYIAEACYALDCSLADIANGNIAKLTKRFNGNKFDLARSQAREKEGR